MAVPVVPVPEVAWLSVPSDASSTPWPASASRPCDDVIVAPAAGFSSHDTTFNPVQWNIYRKITSQKCYVGGPHFTSHAAQYVSLTRYKLWRWRHNHECKEQSQTYLVSVSVLIRLYKQCETSYASPRAPHCRVLPHSEFNGMIPKPVWKFKQRSLYNRNVTWPTAQTWQQSYKVTKKWDWKQCLARCRHAAK